MGQFKLYRKTKGSARKKWKEAVYGSIFFRSWWVLALSAFCCMFYVHSVQNKNHLYAELTQRLQVLELDKQLALQEREELLLQIQSQSDPAWIQMTLMKGLGLVPEGQQKIYFKKEPENRQSPHVGQQPLSQ